MRMMTNEPTTALTGEESTIGRAVGGYGSESIVPDVERAAMTSGVLGEAEDDASSNSSDERGWGEAWARRERLDGCSDTSSSSSASGSRRRGNWRHAIAAAVSMTAVACAALMDGQSRAVGVAALGAAAPTPARGPVPRIGKPKVALSKEYACTMKRSEARRGASNAAPLGCNDDNTTGCARVSRSAVKLSAWTEQIYILCMKCSKLSVPDEWKDKLTFIRGGDVDPCYGKNGLNHWIKASMSHVHVYTDALLRGFDVITVMEEDAMTRDFTNTTEDRVDALVEAVKSNADWSTVRLGYRPYFFEEQSMTHKLPYTCPVKCRCHELTEHACIMPRKGCDMRSSDFYLLRVPRGREIRSKIYQGSTVDMEALQGVRNQLFVVPQLSFQGVLDREETAQINMGNRFNSLCFERAGSNLFSANNSGIQAKVLDAEPTFAKQN